MSENSEHTDMIFKAGTICLNEGASKAKLSLQRAVCEMPINGLNAGGIYSTVEAWVDVQTPLHPPGALNPTSYVVYSNTVVSPSDMKPMANIGSTRGTASESEGQDHGNDYGIGMKDGAWSMHGFPGFLCARLKGAVLTISGWIMSQDVMRCRTDYLRASEAYEMSAATFQVTLVLEDGKFDAKKGKILYPPAGDREGQSMLYCSGLPFSAPDHLYSEIDADGWQDVAYSGRIGLLQALAHWANDWLAYRDGIIRRWVAKVEKPKEELAPHFNDVSVAWVHSMKQRVFARASVCSTLSAKLAATAQKNTLCVVGCEEPLATLLSSKVNYSDYAEKKRFVLLMVEGQDVREANPDLPYERFMRARSMQSSPFYSIKVRMLACQKEVARASHVSSYVSNRRCGENQKTIDDKRKQGICRVSWLPGAQATVSLTEVTEESPVPGAIFVIAGLVVNGLNHGAYMSLCSALFCGITSAASQVQTGVAYFDQSRDSLRAHNGCIPAKPILQNLCRILGIAVQDGSGERGLAHLEREIRAAVPELHKDGVMPEGVTKQLVEALLSSSSGDHGYGRLFLDAKGKGETSSKNFVDRLSCQTVCSFVNLDRDTFFPNIEKTGFGVVDSKFDLAELMHGIPRKQLAYSLRNTLSADMQRRIQIINDPANRNIVNRKWPAAQDAEDSSLVYDKASDLAGWHDKCVGELRPPANTEKLIKRSADGNDWVCRFSKEEMPGSADTIPPYAPPYHFMHESAKTDLRMFDIRSKDDLLIVDAWLRADRPKRVADGDIAKLRRLLAPHVARTLRSDADPGPGNAVAAIVPSQGAPSGRAARARARVTDAEDFTLEWHAAHPNELPPFMPLDIQIKAADRVKNTMDLIELYVSSDAVRGGVRDVIAKALVCFCVPIAARVAYVARATHLYKKVGKPMPPLPPPPSPSSPTSPLDADGDLSRTAPVPSLMDLDDEGPAPWCRAGLRVARPRLIDDDSDYDSEGFVSGPKRARAA